MSYLEILATIYILIVSINLIRTEQIRDIQKEYNDHINSHTGMVEALRSSLATTRYNYELVLTENRQLKNK